MPLPFDRRAFGGKLIVCILDRPPEASGDDSREPDALYAYTWYVLYADSTPKKYLPENASEVERVAFFRKTYRYQYTAHTISLSPDGSGGRSPPAPYYSGHFDVCVIDVSTKEVVSQDYVDLWEEAATYNVRLGDSTAQEWLDLYYHPEQ
jgi:hypothetical protein